MNKKIWGLLFLSVFAVALLSGCTQPATPPGGQQPAVQPAGQPSGGNTPTLEQQQDALWMQKAVQEKDPAQCENIQYQIMREACITKVSGEEPKKLSPEENSELLEKAVNEGNPAGCGEITQQETKDDCYSRVATQINDPEACQGISSESKREYCKKAAG